MKYFYLMCTVIFFAVVIRFFYVSESSEHVSRLERTKDITQTLDDKTKSVTITSSNLDEDSPEIIIIDKADKAPKATVIELQKPVMPASLVDYSFRDKISYLLSAGGLDNKYIASRLIYSCKNAPKSEDEIQELSNDFYQNVDSDPSYELSLRRQYAECLGFNDDDINLLNKLISDGVESEYLPSLLFSYYVPAPEAVKSKIDLENFEKRKIEIMWKAFEQGSVESAVVLATDALSKRDYSDNSSLILPLSLAILAAEIQPHKDIIGLRESLKSELDYIDQQKALEEVAELREKFTNNSKIYTIKDR